MITKGDIQLYKGDCLEWMPTIADKSVDAIICDLPYGTTSCSWDNIIPFEPMWSEFSRICKGAIVLFATEPFTSSLIVSNYRIFKDPLVELKS